MSRIAQAAYFGRAALQGVRRAPFVHFVAVITIALAIFATGLARGTARVLDGLVATVTGEIELTVYLEDGASAEQAAGLAHALSQSTGARAAVVAPEVALGRLSAELGELGASLSELPENPLPYSIEVQVPPAARNPQALRAVAERVRRLPGVGAVDYGEEAIERLSALSRALHQAGWVALVLVVLTTIVVISATLQLAIHSRREEIEIQKLVGATDGFAKVPFLVEGVLQGLCGSLLAVLGLWAFGSLAGPHLAQLLSFLWVPQLGERLFDSRLALQLVGLGCGLGLAGSFVAVGRFLRV